jgi:hypothetical protein
MNDFDGVVSVASPCKQHWEEMEGDRQVRFCGVCAKNVYSLDGLTTAQVRELVLSKEGKLCWRFFVRSDGTVRTKDCPVGLRRARQKVFASILTAAALLAASAAGLLREAGFWNLSTKLGAWSEQVKVGAIPPPALTAPDQKSQWLMGGKRTTFDANNAY